MLDDIDLDIPDQNEPEEPEKGRRSFLTLVGVLAGILVLAIIAISVYAFFVLPQRQAAEQEKLADQTSTAIALAAAASDTPTFFPTATDTPAEDISLTQTVEAALTEASFTDTPIPSDTPIPTNTATTGPGGATQTVQAMLTQAASANDAGGGGDAAAMTTPSDTPAPSDTPDSGGATQTVLALLTQAAAAQGDSPTSAAATGTPSASPTATATPSSLPDTGFADEVNLPGLVLSAAMLLIVVALSRRLRRHLA